jgi:hypothetical protein
VNPYDDAAYAKGYDESLELRRERDAYRDALYTAKRELEVSKKLQEEYLDRNVELHVELDRKRNDLNAIYDAIRERHVVYADLPLPQRVEAVCDALTDARRDNTTLRGLLREACDACETSNEFPRGWAKRAQAALEGRE